MVQTTERLISTDAQRYLLVYMIAVLVIVTALVIVFFIVFQKRKNKLLLDKIMQEKQFEDTVAKTREEIQEQTLKYVGQELHDNIGQLLSLASMQLGMLGVKIAPEIKSSYVETQNIIKESLGEVRALSKSLNTDVIQKKGFLASVKSEIERLNRMKLITSEFVVRGDVVDFEEHKDGIIIFRILQEFISNTVKHSRASELRISLDYSKEELVIEASDNGHGFINGAVSESSGLINMKNRAELLGASYNLTSQPEHGTQLRIVYPISKRFLKALK